MESPSSVGGEHQPAQFNGRTKSDFHTQVRENLHPQQLRPQALGKDCRRSRPRSAPPRSQLNPSPAAKTPASMTAQRELCFGLRDSIPERREEAAAAAPGRGFCASSAKYSRAEANKAEQSRVRPSAAEEAEQSRILPSLRYPA